MDVGAGLALQLSAPSRSELPGPPDGLRRLTLIGHGRRLADLPAAFYTAFRRLEVGSRAYWQIESFSGGMHCCSVCHCVARPLAGQSARYLGATRGSDTEAPDHERLFIYRDGEIDFADADLRFLYFHVDHAQSELRLPCFYPLTPTSLQAANVAFRNVYLKQVDEIEAGLSERKPDARSSASAALSPEGNFADEIGQLLVNRTLLSLYARRDEQAWRNLRRDVGRYHASERRLDAIKTESLAGLRDNPY